MSAERFQAAMKVFQEVCDLRGDARDAALERACGSDAELRAEVEALLQQDGGQTQALRVDAMLDAPQRLAAEIADDSGSDIPNDPTLPKQIGQYRILRRIGEGGMGMVYEARQQSPRRTVAIKVLRPSGNWSSLQKRFEHEAYILGRLQHPGIAQIYEAGRENTASGDRLYLVMELVRGRDVMRYCETQSLSARQRIELFIRICDAVQHAHQKAVIHRDLKPANILVASDESALRTMGGSSAPTRIIAAGQPKILDFGVARLTDSDLQVTTVQTGVGQLIGTLPYMSPEQVVGDPAEVDTRADVYSLGVILHELLTGQLPHDLRNRSMLEAARIIREETPARLSTVNRALRGDLDTIVGKALEKEKQRRYQSAAELASDLRSYLDGAPIAARRDSRWYVVQKTLRRYQLVAGLAAGLLVLAIGSAIAMGVLYQRANAAAHAAKLEAKRAGEAEAYAKQQMKRAEGVSSFMQHVLHAADARAVGRDAKIIDALNYATGKIDELLGKEPESKAAALFALSQTYADFGEYERAAGYAKEALRLQRELQPGVTDRTANVLLNMTPILANAGQRQLAIEASEEGLRMARELTPPNREYEAWALSNLGALYADSPETIDRGEEYLRKSLEMRESISNDDSRVSAATAANTLASLLYRKRKFEEAEAYALRSVELFEAFGADQFNPIYPVALNSVGTLRAELGKFDAARPFLEKSLEVLDEKYGREHPQTMNALIGLAQFERVHGDANRAEVLYREALQYRERVGPANHPQLSQVKTGLGATLLKLKRYQDAEPLLREAYEVRMASAPREFTTSLTKMQYGLCLYHLGRRDDALPILQSGVEQARAAERHNTYLGHEAAAALIEIMEQRGETDYVAELKAHMQSLPPIPGSNATSSPASSASSAASAPASAPMSEKSP